jgi:hypothetical protein
MNPFSKKLVKINDAVAKVNAEIKALEKSVRIIDKIFAVLATFEGKQINARIETALKKELKGAVTFYEKTTTQYRLGLWGYEGIKYDDRIWLTLGTLVDDGILDMRHVKELNARYVLEAERIKNCEAVLPHLNDLCDMYNEIIVKIDHFFYVRDDMYNDMNVSATPSHIVRELFPL